MAVLFLLRGSILCVCVCVRVRVCFFVPIHRLPGGTAQAITTSKLLKKEIGPLVGTKCNYFLRYLCPNWEESIFLCVQVSTKMLLTVTPKNKLFPQIKKGAKVLPGSAVLL